MWNWLVSGAGRRARRCCSTTARPSTPPATCCSISPMPGAHDASSAPRPNTSTPAPRPVLEPMKTHELATVRDHDLDRLAAVAGRLRLRLSQTSSSDVCLASISGGTDIVSCFVLGNPVGPVWRGEIQARGLGMAVDVYRRRRQAARPRREGRAGLHQAFPLDAGRLLERSRRQRNTAPPISSASPASGATATTPRCTRARRRHHLRPLRRRAEPRRRAHRHRRDLPPGRAAAGGAGIARHRPGLARTTCASCCSSGCAKAARSTTR